MPCSRGLPRLCGSALLAHSSTSEPTFAESSPLTTGHCPSAITQARTAKTRRTEAKDFSPRWCTRCCVRVAIVRTSNIPKQRVHVKADLFQCVERHAYAVRAALNLIRESTVLVWVLSVVEALPLSLGVEPTQTVAQQVPDFRRSCSLELRKQAPRLPSLSAGAIVLTWANACRRRGAVELCAAV